MTQEALAFAQLFAEGRPFDVATSISAGGAQLVGRVFRYAAQHGSVPAAGAGGSDASASTGVSDVDIDLNQRLQISVDLDDPLHPHYKPFCFFMGPDGVDMLARNGRDKSIDSLLRLGLTANWMKDHLVNKGNRFALIVLNGAMVDAVLATWDNLFRLVVTAYPELAPYVEKYRAACVGSDPAAAFTTSPAFLARFGSAQRVEEAHMMRDRALAVTPRRFLEETERTFADFRVMLWQWFSANQHFAGTGRTVHAATGQLGVSEMFVRNMTLLELVSQHGAQIIKLDLDPDLL